MMGSSSIRILLLVLTLTNGLCQAKMRSNVIITGTTVAPNFKRLESEITLICPKEYPWVFFNGTRCCASFQKSESADIEFGDSECSTNWIECPAKPPRKCNSLVRPVTCPETHFFSLGVGCCASNWASFDPLLDERCIGQKLEPYNSVLKCCAQLLMIPDCNTKRQRCISNYGVPIISPSKTIFKTGRAFGGFEASKAMTNEICDKKGNIWVPSYVHSKRVSGYFILDLGVHLPVRKFSIRNSGNRGGNSGTKDFAIKISNYSDSNWLSVVNGSFLDPVPFGICTVPLVHFEISQAVLCRFVEFTALTHYRVAAALEFFGVE